jgi:hypothetical protein
LQIKKKTQECESLARLINIPTKSTSHKSNICRDVLLKLNKPLGSFGFLILKVLWNCRESRESREQFNDVFRSVTNFNVFVLNTNTFWQTNSKTCLQAENDKDRISIVNDSEHNVLLEKRTSCSQSFYEALSVKPDFYVNPS